VSSPLSSIAGVARAVVGADGRLLSADAALLDLQRAAGGDDDGPIAVPQLAAVVVLARKLGILLSRPVVAATEDRDLRFWVRARPEGDNVHLAAFDWVETPIHGAASDPDREADLAMLAEGWGWQVDTALNFLSAWSDRPEAFELPRAGQSFAQWFQLREGEGGAMPILSAMLAGHVFRDQPAVLRTDPAIRFRLSGVPIRDALGRIAGYRGRAETLAEQAEPGIAAGDGGENYGGLEFGRHLDRSLRLPLGRIIANAETISGKLEGPLRADYAAYAADIAQAGRHLMALVDDLADLRAVERPGFSTAREALDLADIARRATGLLAVRAADRNIRIDVPAPDDSLMAVGEFRRALQVMVNLIGNAVRYSPAGSSVWVRADILGGMPALIVADQGPGIPAEDQARIFDKFERLGRSEDGGSGLGLYISRLLARAMDGDILVESERGQGARFVFTLPGPAGLPH